MSVSLFLFSREIVLQAMKPREMRELCPGDSIRFAMSSLVAEWVAHMAEKWKNWGQPKS